MQHELITTQETPMPTPILDLIRTNAFRFRDVLFARSFRNDALPGHAIVRGDDGFAWVVEQTAANQLLSAGFKAI